MPMPTLTTSHEIYLTAVFCMQCCESALALAHVVTVRHREIGTAQIGTILIRASGVPRKIETLLLGSWWPCQCVLPLL